MADIDKTLNNVETTINIDPEELTQELQEKQQDQAEQGPPVDIVENEDGSVDLNFDPKSVSPDQGQS